MLLLLTVKHGYSAQQPQEQSQCLLGDLVGKQPRSTADNHWGLDDRWGQAVIKTCGRGLDELKPATVRDPIPIDRYFRMPHKKIRLMDQLGNGLLVCDQESIIRSGSLDRLQMAILGRIADNQFFH
jgi:hypothetical protein